MTEAKQSFPSIKDFVLQEAYERSFEKLVMGLKEYEKEKGRILQERRGQLHDEFDRQNKKRLGENKIKKSALINQCRMQKMTMRHESIQSIIEQVKNTLQKDVCGNADKYRSLLKNLIIQGVVKMLEPVIYVRCLKKDTKLVQGLLDECKKGVENLFTREGIPLNPKYHLESTSKNCIGGVVLTSEDGLIVCTNTLDVRLELAHQQLLPKIRTQLFTN